MSGGHLSDYKEYNIKYIAENIEDIILNNKTPKRKEDILPWDYDDDGNIYEDCKYYYNYSDEVIEKFKEAVILLKKAYIYAHRIDYLVSGDDSEKSFLKALNKELNELK